MHVSPASQSQQKTRLLFTQGNKHAAEEEYISQGSMQDSLKLCYVLKAINILLPKLHHCTGEICSIYNGVVCITFLCIPLIVTRAPWKILKKTEITIYHEVMWQAWPDIGFGVSAWCDTYSGEWIVQVVNGPSNDYNVVNVKPEGQDSCCKAHTYHTEVNKALLNVTCKTS